MAFLKFLSGSVLCFSCVVFGQEASRYPVFKAQPGSAFQQRQIQDNNSQAGTSSLNDTLNAPAAEKANNEFLQFYARQGSEFSATVYYKNDQKLIKRNISQDKLEKGVVIFFGDWCPHCDNFLKVFSNNIEPLKKYGIQITFVNIPPIDKLRNWQEPTIDEFNAVENKISSYGISLTEGVEVVVLGDVATLSKTGIDGLPVFIAVKGGREKYRGIGENCVKKLNFNNLDVLMNFLDIWDNRAMKEQKEESHIKANRSHKDKDRSKKKSKRKAPISKLGKKSGKKIDLAKARAATALLNGDGIISQSLNFYR